MKPEAASVAAPRSVVAPTPKVSPIVYTVFVVSVSGSEIERGLPPQTPVTGGAQAWSVGVPPIGPKYNRAALAKPAFAAGGVTEAVPVIITGT